MSKLFIKPYGILNNWQQMEIVQTKSGFYIPRSVPLHVSGHFIKHNAVFIS